MKAKKRFLNWIWKHSATLQEIGLEDIANDCPYYEECGENYVQNYEPMHNEGYD